jgi:ATP-dependent Clp protease protease subunit
LAVVEKNMERDNFMSAEAAKEFGLVDHIIDKRAAEDLTDKKNK